MTRLNPLGVHFTPTHTGPHHYDFIRRAEPGVVKIVGSGQVGTPDVQIMADCYAAAPEAIHVYRNQPLSEEHDALWRDPAATARRHVTTLAAELAVRVNEAAARDLCLPYRDQWRILGINEPVIELFERQEDMSNYDEWLAMVEGRSALLDIYMSTFVWESEKVALRCGVGNFSGGQPANRKPGEYATYDWFPLTRKALETTRGRHSLVDHEYWDIGGPEEMVNWWTYRWMACDWDCEINVWETGVDRQIRRKQFDGNRGWQGHMSPAAYVDQHRRYMRRCLDDSRFGTATPFTLDGDNDWWSFYIEPCAEEMIALSTELRAGVAERPVETIHIPSIRNEVSKPVPPPAMKPATPPASVPALVHPVSDPRWRVVTQRFGERPDYYARFSVDGVPLRGHNGIDFGTPEGTWITAVDSGNVVEVADDDDGYGRYVKLVHPWGESLYAHLSAWAVAVGDKVERGQWIGDSGNTGNSTGPHLHFGMRVNPYNRQDGWGGYVDPAPYLLNVSAPEAPTTRHAIVKAICAAALEFGVDSDLLLSLAWAESSFLPRAESGQGARGLFQIMPATWAEWGPKVRATDPFVARDSARVGAAYFAWLLKTLNGDVYDAIVAYNAGIGNVLNDGAIGPETYQYAARAIFGRDLLKAGGQ